MEIIKAICDWFCDLEDKMFDLADKWQSWSDDYE